jgi:hypothetical protein
MHFPRGDAYYGTSIGGFYDSLPFLPLGFCGWGHGCRQHDDLIRSEEVD